MKGSLVFRILLTQVMLLLLPVILFIALLYFEETRVKSRDHLFTLDLVLRSKEELIQETLSGERTLLRLLHEENPLLDSIEGSTVFRLSLRDGRYLCDQASLSDHVGQDFTSLVPPDLPRKGLFFNSIQNNRFYYLMPFNDQKVIWGISFSDKQLTDKLNIKKNIPYQTVVALLSSNGKVLLSTEPSWQKERMPSLSTFSIDGKKYMGQAQKVRQSNLTLLIAAPKSANFVEVPHFLAKMLALLLIILVVGGGATLWFTAYLARPLRNLCNVMQRAGDGDLHARYEREKIGFEINHIGKILNEMIGSMTTYIEKIKRERVAKEAFKQELMIGQNVQSSILPKEVPTFPGLEIAARFISAKEVGGDFYDFHVRDVEGTSRLFFSIADTSGKGIFACLYSLTVRSMLRSYGEIHDDLGQIVRETNNLFCHDTGDSGVFVTSWLAFFDEKTRQLEFSNCGHFPALLFREDGEIEKLTTNGMALGVERFHEVATASVTLEEGDLLVLFTDGIVEALNDKMEMYGEARLVEQLDAKRHLSPQTMVDEIVEDVALFAEGTPQHDDLTLLIFKTQ